MSQSAPCRQDDGGDSYLVMQPRNDQRKMSLYLTKSVYEELREQAFRLNRSVSWVAQQAWMLARDKLASLPQHTRAVTALATRDNEDSRMTAETREGPDRRPRRSRKIRTHQPTR